MLSKLYHILLIEDSKAEAFLLAEIIKSLQSKAKINLMSYGKEVIPFLEKSKKALPNLIILDLNLPDVSGKEILQSIKSNPDFNKIPVLVRSGLKGNEQAGECYKLGANWFFEKTENLEKLETQIEEVFNHLF